jgi:hypothetical protein
MAVSERKMSELGSILSKLTKAFSPVRKSTNFTGYMNNNKDLSIYSGSGLEGISLLSGKRLGNLTLFELR